MTLNFVVLTFNLSLLEVKYLQQLAFSLLHISSFQASVSLNLITSCYFAAKVSEIAAKFEIRRNVDLKWVTDDCFSVKLSWDVYNKGDK